MTGQPLLPLLGLLVFLMLPSPCPSSPIPDKTVSVHLPSINFGSLYIHKGVKSHDGGHRPAKPDYGVVNPDGGYGPVNPDYGGYGPVNPEYGGCGPVNPDCEGYGPVNPDYGGYGPVNPDYGGYGPVNPDYGVVRPDGGQFGANLWQAKHNLPKGAFQVGAGLGKVAFDLALGAVTFPFALLGAKVALTKGALRAGLEAKSNLLDATINHLDSKYGYMQQPTWFPEENAGYRPAKPEYGDVSPDGGYGPAKPDYGVVNPDGGYGPAKPEESESNADEAPWSQQWTDGGYGK